MTMADILNSAISEEMGRRPPPVPLGRALDLATRVYGLSVPDLRLAFDAHGEAWLDLSFADGSTVRLALDE